MPIYEMVALLVLSLLGPGVTGLISLAILTHTKRYAIAIYSISMLVQLATVVASVGYNMYVASMHPNWWSNGPMWLLDVVAAAIVAIIGVIETIEAGLF